MRRKHHTRVQTNLRSEGFWDWEAYQFLPMQRLLRPLLRQNTRGQSGNATRLVIQWALKGHNEQAS